MAKRCKKGLGILFVSSLLICGCTGEIPLIPSNAPAGTQAVEGTASAVQETTKTETDVQESSDSSERTQPAPESRQEATLPEETLPLASTVEETLPPVTEPPATEPPVTEPPVTEPPATEPPVTEPPATEPPVIETTASSGGEVVVNGYVVTTTPANFNGHTVCIDPGHQEAGMNEPEPVGPGADVMKKKLTTGTSGIATGQAEYVLNLTASLQMKEVLLAKGYRVVMIRETHVCPMSNRERALASNESGAEIFIRMHANSLDDSSVYGMMTMVPSAANPYVAYLAPESHRLSDLVRINACRVCGAYDRGEMVTDTMTGINWSTIPVVIMEMGFMSNPEEDTRLADPAYTRLLVTGMCEGIDQYFGLA